MKNPTISRKLKNEYMKKQLKNPIEILGCFIRKRNWKRKSITKPIFKLSKPMIWYKIELANLVRSYRGQIKICVINLIYALKVFKGVHSSRVIILQHTAPKRGTKSNLKFLQLKSQLNYSLMGVASLPFTNCHFGHFP